ncbi:MAG: hypothetical protein IIV99_06690, partial [Oscillospiraceae bacterium]|nr:hypothetical protein [Oscillospiraceae bacterium]
SMKAQQKAKQILSKTSTMHYIKLVFRSGLFVAALIIYIYNRAVGATSPFGGLERQPFILTFIWVVFVLEMILRFFPSKLESMGCQKQFKRNFKPTKNTQPKNISGKTTFAIVAAWTALNGAIGALYLTGIIDEGIVLLISLAFSACDMICILFFCPFQTWFMKNKCCTTCRIYNWDYAMMFTPLVFIDNWFYRSILLCAVILLLRWEITYKLYPKRFSEATNCSLSCANCEEKLCYHKKQLKSFLNENKEYLHLKGNPIIEKYKKHKD